MVRTSKITLFIIFCLSFILISQAFAKDIKFFVLEQPVQMLEGVKRVAVLDYENVGQVVLKNQGEKASDYVIAQLLKKDRGIHKVSSGFLGLGRSEGKTYQQGLTTDFYSIAERSRINKVMEEQAFGVSGAVNNEQAASLGEILGVDAVFTGTVEVSTDEKKYREKRTNYKTKKKYYVNCLDRDVKASLNTRIISVATGEIIGQKNITTVNKDSDCGSTPDVKSRETLAEASMRDAAKELVHYFVPKFVEEEIELKEVEVDRFEKKSEKALDLIEDEDFEEAFAIYSYIVKNDPYNHRAIYMKGVLYEIASDYDKAYEQYEMAATMKDDEDDYREAKKRVEKYQELWTDLNNIDINLDVIDYEVSAKDIQKAGVKKVEVDGDSDDRYPIYANPDENSSVLMKVPGKVKLDFISKEGDFYKVKLITGDEGYIKKDDAKDPQ